MSTSVVVEPVVTTVEAPTTVAPRVVVAQGEGFITIEVQQNQPQPQILTIAAPIGVIEAPAVQGPRGIEGAQGTPGAPGGANLVLNAAATVNGHRVVAINADGTVTHLDLSEAEAALGVSLNAALAGEPVTVQRTGLVSHSGWAWTPNTPIFAIDDGQISHTAGSVIIPLGVALDTDTIFIRIDNPIYTEE